MTTAGMPGSMRRWTLAFGLVLLAHGGLIALLERRVPPLAPPGEPALMVDMEPVPAPEAAKEPELTLAEPQAPRDPVPPEPAPPVETPPTPDLAQVEPTAPALPSPEPPPPDAPLPDPPMPDPPMPDPPPLPEAVRPPVVMPRRVPVPVRTTPAPPVTVPRVVAPKVPAPSVAAPPAPAASAAPVSVPASWQARLLAHLNRFKRYPADAQMRRRQGTAVVHLRLMPDGSAEATRLQSGSGTAALDQEAIALIGRAMPLPVPEGGGNGIELAVPIQFTLR